MNETTTIRNVFGNEVIKTISTDMPSGPIIEFKDSEEAYECLKEWQTRLFLDSWIIKLDLMDKNSDDDFGEVEYTPETQKATITLYQKASDVTEVKKCMEKTLVHELLHLSFHVCGHEEDAKVEERLFRIYEHRKVEQMAKSLIMVKYNLPFDWFRNF